MLEEHKRIKGRKKTAKRDFDVLEEYVDRRKNFNSAEEWMNSQDATNILNENENISDELKSIVENGIDAEDAISNLRESLTQTANASSKLTKMFKGVVSALVSMGSAFIGSAIAWGVTKIIEYGVTFAYNKMHEAELIIKKGKEAQAVIDETNKKYAETESSSKQLSERYVELSEGVSANHDANGDVVGYTNLSLTTEEYREFINTSKELGELFPQLISGFDSQGNTILNLSTNAETAADAIAALVEQERALANIKISENIQDVVAGIIEENKQLQKETDAASVTKSVYVDRDTMVAKNPMDQGNMEEAMYEYSIANPEGYNKIIENYSDEIYKLNLHGLNATEWQEFANIYEEINGGIDSYQNSLKDRADFERTKALNNAKQQANYKSVLPQLQAYMSTVFDYIDVSPNAEVQNKLRESIAGLIGNIDLSKLSDEDKNAVETDVQGWLVDRYLGAIEDIGNDDIRGRVAEAYTKLLSLDKSELNAKEYQKQSSELLNEIKQGFIDANGEDKGLENFTEFKINYGLVAEANDDRSPEQVILEDLQAKFAGNEKALSMLQTITVDRLYEVNAKMASGASIESVEGELAKQYDDQNISALNKYFSRDENARTREHLYDSFANDRKSLDELTTSYEKYNKASRIYQNAEASGNTEAIEAAKNSMEKAASEYYDILDQMDVDANKFNAIAAEVGAENVSKYIANLAKTRTSVKGLIEGVSSEEEEEVLGITNQIDDYQSAISSLQETTDALKSGEKIQGNAFTDLVKQFPELIDDVNNLDTALDDLKLDKLEEFSKIYAKSTSAIFDPKERKNASALFQQSVMDMDLSNISLEAMRSKIAGYVLNNSKLSGNNNDRFTIEAMADNTFDREILLKVIADPTMADATLSELQAKFQEVSLMSAPAYLQEQVTSAGTALSAFNTALSETGNLGGVSADTISSITSYFSDLKDLEIGDVFKDTTKGVKLNTNALKRLSREQYKMKIGQFNDSIEAQQDAMKAAAGDADKYQEELKKLNEMELARSQYVSNYKQQMDALSAYNQWQLATQTPNQGAEYDAIQQAIQSAEEAYKDGLTGTDDFKTYAAMLSPTGYDGEAGFLTNLNKAKRYLTEDVSGVYNGLQDLQAAGLAKINDLGDWEITSNSIREVADAMGTSTTIAEAFIGKLEERSGVSTFVGSYEEGLARTNELTSEYLDMQEQLYQLEHDTSGADNSDKIAELRKKMSYYESDMTNAFESGMIAQQEAATDAENDRLAAVRRVLNAEEKLNELKSKGGKLTEAEQNMQKELEMSQRLAAFELGSSVEAILAANKDAPKIVSAEGLDRTTRYEGDENAAEKQAEYNQLIDELPAAYNDADSEARQWMDTLSGMTQEDFDKIKFDDGVYTDGLETQEKALDSLMQKFGVSSDQAQVLFDTLKDLGVLDATPEVKLPEELAKAQQALEESGVTDNLTFDISADFSGLSDEEIKSQIGEIEEIIKMNPELDESALQTLEAQISLREYYFTAKAKIQEVSQEEFNQAVNGGVEAQKTILTKVGIDPNGMSDSEVQIAMSAVQSAIDSQEPAEIPVTMELEDDQFNQLIAAITGEKAELDIGVNFSGDVAKAEELAKDKTATINFVQNSPGTMIKPQDQIVGVKYENKNSIDDVTKTSGNNDVAINVRYQETPPTASDMITQARESASEGIEVDIRADHTEVERAVAAQENLKGKDVVYGIEASEVYGWSAPNKYGTASYLVDSTNITLWTPPVKKGYVEYHAKAVGTIPPHAGGVVPAANGTMINARANGTFRADKDGSAYNVANMIPAHASGNVAIQKDETALVNELGTESVVNILPPYTEMCVKNII